MSEMLPLCQCRHYWIRHKLQASVYRNPASSVGCRKARLGSWVTRRRVGLLVMMRDRTLTSIRFYLIRPDNITFAVDSALKIKKLLTLSEKKERIDKHTCYARYIFVPSPLSLSLSLAPFALSLSLAPFAPSLSLSQPRAGCKKVLYLLPSLIKNKNKIVRPPPPSLSLSSPVPPRHSLTLSHSLSPREKLQESTEGNLLRFCSLL